MKPTKRFKSIDEYIRIFPKDVAARLKEIRQIVCKAAPDATEGISYNIPAYKLNGILIYFAAFSKHIGIYPFSPTMKLTPKEEEKYRKGKGTLQFPHDEKLPTALITRAIKNKIKAHRAKKTKAR